MSRAKFSHAILTAALSAVTVVGLLLVAAGPASAAPSGQAIAQLALDNLGKGAGYCSTVNSAANSLGGTSFDGSCTDNGGNAVYWCADFARWVWQNSGVSITGLNAAAGSFVASASQNGSTVHTSSSYVPQPGDAVVYGYNGNGYADHVGIVTAVYTNGVVQTVNGDFENNQTDQTNEVTFAESSTVQEADLPAAQSRVGSTPGTVGMTITDYVTPGGVAGGGSPTPPPPPAGATHGDLARNGGFNNGFSYWTHGAATNVQVYGSSGFTKPYEGTGYLATNTSASGGSVAQDIGAKITAGNTYCASADLTTVGAKAGGSGTFAIWLTGGTSASEGSNKPTGALAGNNAWTKKSLCVTATKSHTLVRVQFYPKINGPTVGIDAVRVNPDLARNGGFNNAFAYWTHTTGTNVQVYGSSNLTKPYEGTGYLATNTSAAGGSVSQSAGATITSGRTYCVSADLTTVGSTAGGSGRLALYLTGGTTEGSAKATGTLPGNNTWTQDTTCVTATANHSGIRVQFNPAKNGPTVGIDAVNVNPDAARNGGFNNGFSYWRHGAGTNVQVYGSSNFTKPYEGTGYLATNTGASGGSVAQDITASITVGNTYCASALLTTVGAGSGASGTFAIWLTGGSNASEGSNKPTGALAGNNSWTEQTTCVTATKTHSILRVQFYPKVNGATVGLDAIRVG